MKDIINYIRGLYFILLQHEDHRLCLDISFFAGISHSTNDINRYNHLTYAGNYNDIICQAKTLCAGAGVNLQHGGSIHEIIQFQQYLEHEYRIVIYAISDEKLFSRQL